MPTRMVFAGKFSGTAIKGGNCWGMVFEARPSSGAITSSSIVPNGRYDIGTHCGIDVVGDSLYGAAWSGWQYALGVGVLDYVRMLFVRLITTG